jgi:hypothetical protein
VRPLITLVTPNYNDAAFLGDCLDSVLDQDREGLEHIVVDGASTDGSAQIIEAHRPHLTHVISEPDAGHADALNKGFAVSSGDIMGWINSDDILHAGALRLVRRVFEARPDVDWITGRPSSMNARGEMIHVGPARPWSRLRFLSGDHFWIQQESTFWRRRLWERAGARLDTGYDVANDFELWARFFRYAELYTVDRMIGCFRVREGQRSVDQQGRYRNEVRQVLARELDALDPAFRARFAYSLPRRPIELSAAHRKAAEARLGVMDPPIIRASRLHPGAPSASRAPAGESVNARLEALETAAPPAPGAAGTQGGGAVTALASTLRLNWRFLAGLAAGLAGHAVLALALPAFAEWIALTALGLVLAALAGAAALKTRRIVKRQDALIQIALGGLAEHELARQDLETRFDALQEAQSRGGARPVGGHGPT